MRGAGFRHAPPCGDSLGEEAGVGGLGAGVVGAWVGQSTGNSQWHVSPLWCDRGGVSDWVQGHRVLHRGWAGVREYLIL